jgi:protein-disulfide isomerase
VASRKEEKEQRRQARLEAERTAAGEERRKKLMTLIGATVLAAIVVVVALIVVSQSGSETGGDASSIDSDIPVIGTIDGLGQDGLSVGDASAKVTISEFGDLQCPVCKQFSETVVPELLAKSGSVGAGDAKLEFQQFVIIGPESTDAAKAALAASEQGRYWQFIEIFYANQGTENSGYVTDEFLTSVAEAAGVTDIDAWNQSRADPKWDAVIAQTQSDASKAGFTGTPSVLVTGPGGEKIVGASPSTDQIEQAVQEVG